MSNEKKILYPAEKDYIVIARTIHDPILYYNMYGEQKYFQSECLCLGHLPYRMNLFSTFYGAHIHRQSAFFIHIYPTEQQRQHAKAKVEAR